MLYEVITGTVGTSGRTTAPYGRAEDIEVFLHVLGGEGTLDA